MSHVPLRDHVLKQRFVEQLVFGMHEVGMHPSPAMVSISLKDIVGLDHAFDRLA